MLKKALDFRPYRPGEEDAILTLFKQVFGKPMSLKYWRWRFLENPVGCPMIYLAWDGDKLAAHYAVSPVILVVGQIEYISALSVTTMTHQSYRGERLFPHLATRLYSLLSQNDFLMIYGFPNDFSHRGFINNLGWKDIYEIPLFCFNININSSLPEVHSRMIELTEFDQEFDSLWKKVRADYNILVKRDRNYLNWRFKCNPIHHYKVFSCIEDSELIGYAIFKEYQNSIDLIDILTIKGSSAGRDLVVKLIQFCISNNLCKINTWLPPWHPLHQEFERLGFCNESSGTYFAGRNLNDTLVKLDLTDARNWYYSMSDSDVY